MIGPGRLAGRCWSPPASQASAAGLELSHLAGDLSAMVARFRL